MHLSERCMDLTMSVCEIFNFGRGGHIFGKKLTANNSQTGEKRHKNFFKMSTLFMDFPIPYKIRAVLMVRFITAAFYIENYTAFWHLRQKRNRTFVGLFCASFACQIHYFRNRSCLLTTKGHCNFLFGTPTF